MIRSLYTSVSGLISLEAKQSITTNNMANANTTGYKVQNLSLKSFDEVLLENKDKISQGMPQRNEIGSISLGVRIDETGELWTQGMFKETNNQTDFAIDGRGFFTIERTTANGTERYYTRDGSFKVDIQGYLVTSNGDRVLGTNGHIQVGSGKISSDNEGNLSVDGRDIGSFLTADFQNYDELEKIGDNLYTGANPMYNTQVYVGQGVLEGSNVNTVSEMTDMMTTMRNFETNQKMFQMIDESLGKAVNEIGAIR